MREAKFAATVFGAVSVCLVGGLAAAYMTAPEVGSASVSDTAEAIGEELIFAPIATSVSTTTIVTTYTSATTQCTTETTTTAPVFYEADSTAMEDDTSYDTSLWSYTTEAYTEPYTETYDYSFPAIDQTADEEIGIYSDVTVIETAPVETTTTAQMTTTAEPVTEPPTETPTEAPTEAPADPGTSGGTEQLAISDSDFIILCNVVAHEAGSSWISEYDKACIVEVIMNRVNSPLYPNTISGVLTQPYQFTGCESYAFLGTYSGYVTESVKQAVRLYFNDPGSFSHGYMSFWGDGVRNYFC